MLVGVGQLSLGSTVRKVVVCGADELDCSGDGLQSVLMYWLSVEAEDITTPELMVACSRGVQEGSLFLRCFSNQLTLTCPLKNKTPENLKILTSHFETVGKIVTYKDLTVAYGRRVLSEKKLKLCFLLTRLPFP